MIKSILLFIIITLLIIVSVDNLNNSAQLNIEALSSFLFLVFILAPLLVYAIYLIAINIENYLNSKKTRLYYLN